VSVDDTRWNLIVFMRSRTNSVIRMDPYTGLYLALRINDHLGHQNSRYLSFI
jgi:hypothetical protein